MYKISPKILIFIWVIFGIIWGYHFKNALDGEGFSSLLIYGPALLVWYSFVWRRNRLPKNEERLKAESASSKKTFQFILTISALAIIGWAIKIELAGGGAEYMLVLLSVFVWFIVLLAYLTNFHFKD